MVQEAVKKVRGGLVDLVLTTSFVYPLILEEESKASVEAQTFSAMGDFLVEYSLRWPCSILCPHLRHGKSFTALVLPDPVAAGSIAADLISSAPADGHRDDKVPAEDTGLGLKSVELVLVKCPGGRS